MNLKTLHKKLVAASFIAGIGLASPAAQAGWLDDAVGWVETAANDVVDWVDGAVDTIEDTYEDFVNTLENIGTWFTGEDNVVGYFPSAGENPVYSLAQGCFAIQSPVTGKYFRLYHHGGAINDGMNYDVTASSQNDAARFFFKPTKLGMFMMTDTQGRYLASRIPGEMTAGTYSGSFAEFDTTAHEQADGTYLYRFRSIGLDQTLRNNYSNDRLYYIDPLNPADVNSEPYFKLIPQTGCADYPEITTNVTGDPDVFKGDPTEAVRGFIDPHTHITSYEFMGGKFMHGKPFSRYGVEDALQDSKIVHGPDGALDLIGNLQGYDDVNKRYDTRGYPDFPFWPNYKQLSHMGYYHKWMERSWLAGQRMIVTHLVENEVLCNLQKTVNPASWVNPNSCNTMDSIELQVNRMFEMQAYIDAQAGGPGKGFFRIVKSSEEARAVIADGKLAVIMGVEASEVMNCGQKDSCTYSDVEYQLDKLYNWGIRSLFPVHKFDNRLGGVIVEDGLMNLGEWIATGHFFGTQECDAETHGAHMTSGFPAVGDVPVLGDIINGIVTESPTYDESIEHCNELGLSPLGQHLIQLMIDKNMIIELDHMSDKTATQVLNIAASRQYSGLVSSHSWMAGSKNDDLHYNLKRVIQLGGFATPYNGNAYQMDVSVSKYLDEMETTPYFAGVGIATDMSGLGGQAGPRYDGDTNPLVYPFTSEFGLVFDKQKSGNRTFDISNEGVAHYGLVADHLQDIRINASNRVYETIMNSAEAYLQMWERTEANNTVTPKWQNFEGALKQVSIGADGTTWGVSANDYIYRRTANSDWQEMPGRLSNVSAGNSSNIWGVASNETIWQWNGNDWDSVSGALKIVSAAADGSVWGLNSIGKIWHKTPGTNWEAAPGDYTYVSAGSASNVWAINANNQVYKWNGSSFELQDGNLRVVEAAADGTVWGLTSEDLIVSLQSDGSWLPVSSQPMLSLSVGNSSQVMATAHDHSIWYRDGNIWGKLVAQDSNLCLDFPGTEPSNGTATLVWECGNALDWQQWTYNAQTKLIQNKHRPEYCLDHGSVSEAFEGGKVNTYQCINHPNLQWEYDGRYIRNVHNTNLVIDASGTSNGAAVIQSAFHGGASQQWKLTQ